MQTKGCETSSEGLSVMSVNIVLTAIASQQRPLRKWKFTQSLHTDFKCDQEDRNLGG